MQLSETLAKVKKMKSQILFLAYHRKMLKYIIFLLEKNPWETPEEGRTGIKVYVYTTSIEINLPPRPIKNLKSLHLLWRENTKEEYVNQIDGALLFQYRKDMWSVSLNKSNKISQIFNPNVREMQPRKAVRKYTDLAHVYCITSSASKESVVRVGLSDG